MRAPNTGVRAECAGVQFASRCGCASRPHHCAALQKRCIMVWPNWPSAVTAARKPRARAPWARQKLACAWRAR
eukprot:8967176-Lingulodinium_polyedra.AAC.1